MSFRRRARNVFTTGFGRLKIDTTQLATQRPFAYRLYILYRQVFLGPVVPLYRALSGRLKFTVGRQISRRFTPFDPLKELVGWQASAEDVGILDEAHSGHAPHVGNTSSKLKPYIPNLKT